MEWVETTGRTVDEAKEAALDELGVDEADAEFEVVAEPQTGLFGRLRSEARVRARVMPTAPRAKEERRDRRRRSGSQGSRASVGSGSGAASGEPPKGAAASPGPALSPAAEETAETSPAPREAVEGSDRPRPGRQRDRGASRNGGSGDRVRAADQTESKGAQVEVELEEQARIAEGFLTDFTAEFGLSASVTQSQPDEDTVELQLAGPDLGILIGPKGSTLIALQHITRTVVHHETGATNGHLNVDVGGYRHKRTEALSRFATQVAHTVKESGDRTALEPMSAVDRKVVHDTISEIDGVATISEGEEPRRRVVVMPASTAVG